MLIVPRQGAGKSVGKESLVCWNGRGSGPGNIRRAAVAPNRRSGNGDQPGPNGRNTARDRSEGVALGRHGIKATAMHERVADDEVARRSSRAADVDADMMVMGLYGHARVREMVLGGVSRDLLRRATLPLLVAH